MKTLLALTMATLWIGHAHAQGTFSFSNRVAAAGLDQPIYDVDGVTKLAGPNIVAAIFLNGQQLGAAAPFRTGLGAGYWNPGFSDRVVAGKFSGDVVTGFVVYVWDISTGATLPEARAMGGKYAESAPFSITLGGAKADPLLPADIPGVMSNFKSFNLAQIPEPSVVALGAAGVIVMLAGRWRGRGMAARREREKDL